MKEIIKGILNIIILVVLFPIIFFLLILCMFALLGNDFRESPASEMVWRFMHFIRLK